MPNSFATSFQAADVASNCECVEQPIREGDMNDNRRTLV